MWDIFMWFHFSSPLNDARVRPWRGLDSALDEYASRRERVHGVQSKLVAERIGVEGLVVGNI